MHDLKFPPPENPKEGCRVSIQTSAIISVDFSQFAAPILPLESITNSKSKSLVEQVNLSSISSLEISLRMYGKLKNRSQF